MLLYRDICDEFSEESRCEVARLEGGDELKKQARRRVLRLTREWTVGAAGAAITSKRRSLRLMKVVR
jgi:hypothetical protein